MGHVKGGAIDHALTQMQVPPTTIWCPHTTHDRCSWAHTAQCMEAHICTINTNRCHQMHPKHVVCMSTWEWLCCIQSLKAPTYSTTLRTTIIVQKGMSNWVVTMIITYSMNYLVKQSMHTNILCTTPTHQAYTNLMHVILDTPYRVYTQ